MANDIKKKLLKHSEIKENIIQRLKEIEENNNTCIKIIDGAIERINNIIPKYIEGYELRIANERKTPIKINNRKEANDDFMISFHEEGENIKIDIVLKGIDKEFIIGEIDCDVIWYEVYGKTYRMKLNYIALHEEYQNKGYGTEILKHIPSIISYLYKCEVTKVETTAEIIKYDKYKLHDITYSKRIKNIEAWLIENNFKPNGDKDGLEVYEMDLRNNKNVDNYMVCFKNLIIDILNSSSESTYDINSRNKSISECENILKVICKNKYSDGIVKQKALMLQQIKEAIEKAYNELKEDKERTIFAINEVNRIQKEITTEELKINKLDGIEETAIKLYCQYFNFGTVGNVLEEMGYTTQRKGTTEKRKYTASELKEIIGNSNIKNEKLKKYVDYVFIANDSCK